MRSLQKLQKLRGGGSEVVKSQVESQTFVIGKYAQWANNLEEQITTLNNARKENTGIVGGIGDWVGEKTGAYSTGKEAYEEQIKQIQDRAKALHAQIINEFSEKTLSEDEKTSIQKLIQKLKIQTGARLEHVGWARAVSNSLDDNQNLPSDLGSKTFHMTLGAMEGGYESVAGIMEISGKAIGICTAYIGSAVSEGKFDASVGKQISADVARIFSLLTLKNAQKAIALLPKALESFMNAKPDVQAEGFGKFFGMIIAPLGIGAKTVTAAKSVGEAGMATVKAGAEIMKK